MNTDYNKSTGKQTAASLPACKSNNIFLRPHVGGEHWQRRGCRAQAHAMRLPGLYGICAMADDMQYT